MRMYPLSEPKKLPHSPRPPRRAEPSLSSLTIRLLCSCPYYPSPSPLFVLVLISWMISALHAFPRFCLNGRDVLGLMPHMCNYIFVWCISSEKPWHLVSHYGLRLKWLGTGVVDSAAGASGHDHWEEDGGHRAGMSAVERLWQMFRRAGLRENGARVPQVLVLGRRSTSSTKAKSSKYSGG
ncbi:hypothetical protein BD779DRAFT_97053 [Infundibulicybe gibba]|nr:hypothetical protein BD779DRAFT_97053 [Infundibulicybe gibba]